MARCRTLILSLLLVHSAIGQYMDLSNNVFLKHMISARAAGFQAPQYLPPKEQLTCTGQEVCVGAGQCQNGYFTQNFGGSRRNCDIDTEVCCLYRPPPTTPKPTPVPSTPCLDANYACISSNQCVNGEINIKGYSKPKSADRCYAPEVCCRVPPTDSTVLTEDGYVVRVPQNPLIETPVTRQPVRPPVRVTDYAVASTTTPRATTSRQYLPPLQGEETREHTVTGPRPLRGDGDLSEPIVPNKPNRPIAPTTSFTPAPFTPFAPVRITSACAAALICTEIQFCNSTGFISKTPINLTPEQELYRVPLSDCQDSSKGLSAGKCCRDPDYIDPWPVNQISRGPRSTCATKDPNPVLKGVEATEAGFAEYPWQAMILLESTKSLLCGGAIIGSDFVLTSARCVAGLKPFDVLIKAGEWKLGSTEEPFDFQIRRAKNIITHPKYDNNTLAYDLAILYLDANLEFQRHIAPICIDENLPEPNDQCWTSGWGKLALSVHMKDAIMHHSIITPVADSQCYPTEHSICGVSKIDGCELDFGSALACNNGPGSYVLQGIYTAEDQCGQSHITFARPDAKWINEVKTRFSSPRRH